MSPHLMVPTQRSHEKEIIALLSRTFLFYQNMCFDCLINDFFSSVIFCCQKGPFPAQTAQAAVAGCGQLSEKKNEKIANKYIPTFQ